MADSGLSRRSSPAPPQVDAVPRPDRKHLLPLAERFQQLRPFDDVFFVSAKKGKCGALAQQPASQGPSMPA